MRPTDVLEKIQDYLDSNTWKYDTQYDEEKPVIKTGVKVDCKLQSVNLLISIKDDCYSVFVVSPIKADDKTRDAVMKYITMANYGLRKGNFELDVSDGEVRYKHYITLTGDDITDEVIEESILLPVMMMKKYGDGLCAIMMGFSTPEDEIKKAES